jgi:coenzyme F420-reducing hydrogenase delta subunit
LLKNFLEFVGVEPGRVNFTWISAAEGSRFAEVMKEVSEKVRELGPAGGPLKRQIGG